MIYKALILKAHQLTPFHILNPYCYKVQESLPCALQSTVAGAFSRVLFPSKYFLQTSKQPIFEEMTIGGKSLLHSMVEAGILVGPPDTREFIASLETVRVWRTEAPGGKLISSVVQREWLLSSTAIIYVIFGDEKIAKTCEDAIRSSPVLTIGKSESIFIPETKNKLMYEAEEQGINSSESPVPDKYLPLIMGEILLLPIHLWNIKNKAYEIRNFFVPYRQIAREEDYKIMQYKEIKLRKSIPGYGVYDCEFLQHIAKTI
jgi:hypothetical protein